MKIWRRLWKRKKVKGECRETIHATSSSFTEVPLSPYLSPSGRGTPAAFLPLSSLNAPRAAHLPQIISCSYNYHSKLPSPPPSPSSPSPSPSFPSSTHGGTARDKLMKERRYDLLGENISDGGGHIRLGLTRIQEKRIVKNDSFPNILLLRNPLHDHLHCDW